MAQNATARPDSDSAIQTLERQQHRQLLAGRREITQDATLSGREVLPADEFWLPALLRRLGPAGRALWLMHEPPQVRQIVGAYAWNPEWTKAVERFRPLLTISGHDHETPKRYNAWHGRLGETVCVNVGRGVTPLHYCVLDPRMSGLRPTPRFLVSVRGPRENRWSTEIVPRRSRARLCNRSGGGYRAESD